MRIQLTDEEYYELYEIAKERQRINEQNKIQDKKQNNKKSSFQLHWQGARAEYGFCKLFNLKYDKSTHSRKGTKDCILKGYRIDVKGSENLNKNVYVRYKKDYSYVDIFAFCYIDGKFVEVIGYQFRDFVTNPNHLIEGYNGPCYKVPVKNLHKFKTYANP